MLTVQRSRRQFAWGVLSHLLLAMGLAGTGLAATERLAGNPEGVAHAYSLLSQPLGWPAEFWGVGYFAALAGAWLLLGWRRGQRQFRPLLRLAAVTFIAALGAATWEDAWNIVLLTATVASLGLWAISETFSGREGTSHQAWIIFVAVFVSTSSLLLMLEKERQWTAARNLFSTETAERRAADAPMAANPKRDRQARPAPAHSSPGAPLVSPAAPTEDAEGWSAEVLERALRATVRVRDEELKIEGSGAIIASDLDAIYILTAHHLVGESPTVAIWTFSDPLQSATAHTAQVLMTSPRQDLALLRSSANGQTLDIFPLCPLTGLPEQRPLWALSVGCSGGAAPTRQPVRVISDQQVRHSAGADAVPMWQVEPELAEGRSGGALLDSGGCLLGLASGNSGNQGYYCHGKAIHNFLVQARRAELLPEAVVSE